jgi:hypothetical protein
MSKAFLARTMVPTEPTKVQNSSMLSGKRYNAETLSPFDVTQYRGGGRAGSLPALHHRTEAEEEAFSMHVHTSRAALQPAAFLRKGEGLGGRSNAALAVEAKEKRTAQRVAPVLYKVRVVAGEGAGGACVWVLAVGGAPQNACHWRAGLPTTPSNLSTPFYHTHTHPLSPPPSAAYPDAPQPPQL